MNPRLSMWFCAGLVLFALMSGCATERIVSWPLKIVKSVVDAENYHAELTISSAAMPPHVEGELIYSDLTLTINNKSNKDLYFKMSDIVVFSESNEPVIVRDASLQHSIGFEIYLVNRGETLQLQLHSSSRLPGANYFFKEIEFGSSEKQDQYFKKYY